MRKGTKITDVMSYPWHHHWKPLALRGLKIEELMSAEELVLYACGEVERLSSPCAEIALALYGEGVISCLTSYSYRPAHVHLLGSG